MSEIPPAKVAVKYDARQRMQFDSSSIERYERKQKEEKQRKQQEYEHKMVDKMKPKLLAAHVSVASSIAGELYNKGVRNGNNKN